MRTSLAATAIAALLLAALVPATPAAAADLAVTGVVSLDGVGVAGTEVGWFDPTTGVSGESVTAADGSYSLIVADGHPYVLYAGIDHTDRARWVPLGGERYLGTFMGVGAQDYLYQSLTPFALGGVQNIALTHPGSIVGKTNGLAKQRVQLVSLQGNVLAKVRASATGRYEFTGLIPGRYRVSAFGALQAYAPYISGDLIVTAGSTRHLNPRLVQSGTVTGRVTVAGKPAKGVVVSVADVGVENGTLTDARGRYTIKNVPAGRSTLYFGGQGTTPTGDYFYRGYQRHKKVTVKGGKTATLNSTAPRPTKLVGTVTPTTGAKNLTVKLVDKDGYLTVNHYEKVSKSKPVDLSLPGIKAGTYTLVITDSKKTRYSKKTVTLKYGKTTSIGSVKLSKKTVTISGAIVGQIPYFVAFENDYVNESDMDFTSNNYTIRGIVPGPGVVQVSAGGRSGPGPYFTDDNRYALNPTTSTTLDVSVGGPEIGTFTGTMVVGSLPIATGAYLSGPNQDIPLSDFDVKSNFAYVTNGKIAGEVGIDGTTNYTLGMQYNGWPKEFIAGSPFWLELPGGSVSITGARGTTVDVGTIQLVVAR